MTISVDYTGRDVDLFIMQGMDPLYESQIHPSFGDDGQVIAGIEQAVQVFLQLFYTTKGSVQYDPDRGVTFITFMQEGRMRTSSDVQFYFYAAADEIITYLNAAQRDVPDDENITDIQLLTFALVGDTVNLSVRIVTAAGTSRVIILPVKVVIR